MNLLKEKERISVVGNNIESFFNNSLILDEAIKTIKVKKIAESMDDTRRIEDYADLVKGYFLMDKGFLHAKIFKIGDNWSIELGNESMDKEILELCNMPSMRNVNIEEPLMLKDYPGGIPVKVYEKINNAEKYLNGKLKYFVAEEARRIDPVLLVQVNGKREYTFVLGYWDR